jgi:hypothetical protein
MAPSRLFSLWQGSIIHALFALRKQHCVLHFIDRAGYRMNHELEVMRQRKQTHITFLDGIGLDGMRWDEMR